MAFGKSLQKTSNDDTRPSESPFLRLPPGERLIRILDDEETPYWSYWLDVNVDGRKVGRSIVVGYPNPIKEYMDNLGEDNPAFRRIRKRSYLNVLDRTLVKRDPNGAAYYPDEQGNYPEKSASGEALSALVPNNRVMILDTGPQLMELFTMLNNRVRDRRDPSQLLPIQRVDLRVVTSGKGRDTTRAVYPDIDTDELPQELADLPRYDLAKIVEPMPNESIMRLLEGDDYSEVIKDLGWKRIEPSWL